MSRQRIQAVGSVCAKARHEPRIPLHDSAISSLYQQGSARIRFPHSTPGALQAVLLNTAGGLTGDDNLEWNVGAESGSRLTISTAACEKIYRTHGPAATQQTNIQVAAGARLDWLPQESIIFNGASLQRKLNAHLDETAQALFVESFVLGRQAMQETIDRVSIHDRWRIHRAGSLLHAEDFRLSPGRLLHARQQSALHQYSAISTLVFVSNQSQEALGYQLDTIRSLIERHSDDVIAGASLLAHRIVVRTLAINSFSLRKFLIPCIESVNNGASIPTVWNV